MKRLFLPVILLALLVLAGAGCFSKTEVEFDNTQTENTSGQYKSEDFGFQFSYPTYLEVKQREKERWNFSYLGKDMDFFAVLSDSTRGDKSENIFYVYSWSGASISDFRQAIVVSGEKIEITESKEVTMGEANMTRLISTTDSGIAKTHYVWSNNGKLIIFSVFLEEEKNAEPILQTVRKI